MFKSDFARAAMSFVGATVFTVAAIGAAVGPARVAETTPVVYAAMASTAPVAAG